MNEMKWSWIDFDYLDHDVSHPMNSTKTKHYIAIFHVDTVAARPEKIKGAKINS